MNRPTQAPFEPDPTPVDFEDYYDDESLDYALEYDKLPPAERFRWKRLDFVERFEHLPFFVCLPIVAPVTFATVVLMIAVYLHLAVSSTPDAALLWLYAGGGERDAVSQGQWWRFFTTSFIHLYWWHILISAYCITFLGYRFEVEYGWWRTALFYLATSAATVTVGLLTTHSAFVGGGGIVVGLFGGTLAGKLAFKDSRFANVSNRAVFIDAGLIGLVLLLGFTFMPFVTWGLLGGVVVGFAFSLAYALQLTSGYRLRRYYAMRGVIVGLVLAMFVSCLLATAVVSEMRSLLVARLALERAVAAEEAGDVDRVIENMELYFHHDTQPPTAALIGYLNSLRQAGRPELAVVKAQLALEKQTFDDPKGVYVSKGASYVKLGMYSEARRVLSSAVGKTITERDLEEFKRDLERQDAERLRRRR